MKLAISNIAWSAAKDKAAYGLMQRKKFSGLEIAPTRIFPQNPYGDLAAAEKWSCALKERYGLSVVSMQSIWYGRQENIFGSRGERSALLEYTKQAINFAGAVGAGNIVFGCPKNRRLPEKYIMCADSLHEYYKQAEGFFRTLGDYAMEHNIIIGMEANPVMYDTNFINTTQEALDFIAQVSSPGLRLNLDTGTMLANHESAAVLQGSADLIYHVHISEPGLAVIKERDIHFELADILRKGHYGGFISIEMSNRADFSAMAACMDYVERVFGEDEKL